MKLTNTPAAIVLLTVSTAAALSSQHAAAQSPGFYVGGSIGRSEASNDEAKVRGGLAAAGFATASISDRERDTAYKLFGGYQVNRHFALEASYFDLGRFGYTATTVPAGTLRADIRLKGIGLDLVGQLPLTEQFALLGKIGANYTQARDTFRGTGAVVVANARQNKRDLGWKLGVGATYSFTPALGLRAEAERYRVDDAIGNKGQVDLFTLGVVYRFGP